MSSTRCLPRPCGEYGGIANASWLGAVRSVAFQESGLSFRCNAGACALLGPEEREERGGREEEGGVG